MSKEQERILKDKCRISFLISELLKIEKQIDRLMRVHEKYPLIGTAFKRLNYLKWVEEKYQKELISLREWTPKPLFRTDLEKEYHDTIIIRI